MALEEKIRTLMLRMRAATAAMRFQASLLALEADIDPISRGCLPEGLKVVNGRTRVVRTIDKTRHLRHR